jgi:hypothetical protein
VLAGYTVSHLDGETYLHDSQGNRWARVDPFLLTVEPDPDGDRVIQNRGPFTAQDWTSFMRLVEQVANGEPVPT